MSILGPEIDLPVSGIGRYSGGQELDGAEALFDSDYFTTVPIVIIPTVTTAESYLNNIGGFEEVVMKVWTGVEWLNCLFLWNGDEWLPVPPAIPLGPISITNISVTPNSWGDVRVAWDTANFIGSMTVKVIDVSNDTVVTTKSVTASEAYFEGEVMLPHWGFSPSYFRVTVNADTVTETWENSIGSVDDSWVKKVIVFGGQSNCEGHLTFLSGAGGRKDLVSASDMRVAVADGLSLSPAEVMPFNLTYGDSAIDKKADADYPTGTNYWYDLDGDVNGPRLTSFLSGIDALKSKVIAIIWAQGETDAVASYDYSSSRVSSTTRWYDSTDKVFDKIRVTIPAIQAPILFQPMGRSWWMGTDQDGVTWQQYRDAQRLLIGDRSDVIVGSWAPGSERISGYQTDGIHYSSAVFHDAAAEHADSILNETDRLTPAPTWVDMVPLTGVTAVKSGSDTVMQWNATGYSKFAFTNLSVADGTVIYSGILNTNSYTFTAAAQTAEYGFTSDYADFVVCGYNESITTQGPGVLFYDLVV